MPFRPLGSRPSTDDLLPEHWRGPLAATLQNLTDDLPTQLTPEQRDALGMRLHVVLPTIQHAIRDRLEVLLLDFHEHSKNISAEARMELLKRYDVKVLIEARPIRTQFKSATKYFEALAPWQKAVTALLPRLLRTLSPVEQQALLQWFVQFTLEEQQRKVAAAIEDNCTAEASRRTIPRRSTTLR